MKPYYQDDSVTIYNCRCEDILEELPKFVVEKTKTVCITDPPYGIGAGLEKEHNGWKDYGKSKWDKNRPDKYIFDIIRSCTDNQIIWGGNYFADLLPPSMGWLSWDKGQRDFSLADFELAWTSWQRASRCFVYSRAKSLQDVKQHPTQKSLSLMKWCIELSGDYETILDPFAGSCTTGRAAKDLNRKCICIECEEKYAEVGAKRMCQEVMNFN